MENLPEILITILGAGVASFAAVKANMLWVIKTLERHEKYHDSHFKEFDELYKKGIKHGTSSR
jgi:hypothetical protein